MRPGLILDSDSLLSYASGENPAVGSLIARRADQRQSVLAPVLCLAEAYRRAASNQADLLDMIQGIPHVVVTPAEPDMAVFLGGFARRLERMDLAQLAITAAEHYLIPVLTSERKRLTQVLAEGWPIIDL